MQYQIVIIDDSEINQKVLARCLQTENIELLQFYTGEDGFKYIQQNGADLILLDLILPGIDGFEICRRLKAHQTTASIPILILSGVEKEDIKERVKTLGASDFIVKPFHVVPLQKKIHRFLPHAHYAYSKNEQDRTANDNPLQKLRALVAEDDPVNQKLIATLLKPYCDSFDIVDNGRDVLKKITENSYDLILMDIQMPIMNGIEATIHLREDGYEKPIIAVTANVVPHDMQQGLAVGINAYVHKPIKRNDLFIAINQWCPRADLPVKTANKQPPPSSNVQTFDLSKPVFDIDQAFEIYGDDQLLLKDMITDFCKDQGRKLEILRHALGENDQDTVQRIAHSMKGASSQVAAEKLRHFCLRAEKLAKNGQLTSVQELVSSIETSFNEYVDYIKQYDWESFTQLYQKQA